MALAVGWFLLIGPRYSQANSLHERTAAAELRLPKLEHRLAELRRQDDHRAQYEAQLAKDRKALGLNAPPEGLYFVDAIYPDSSSSD